MAPNQKRIPSSHFLFVSIDLFSIHSVFKVENVFADKIQVKSWNVYGLPDHRFSIESAVILQLS